MKKILTVFLLTSLGLGSVVLQYCTSGPVSESNAGVDDTIQQARAQLGEKPFVEVDPVKPAAKGYFSNPLHLELKASGTFAELRANHFHGGLDLRTQSVEGYPVLAVADGYITRLKISPYGYGNVLYVSHDNGYMSVYGHLKKFHGPARDYTEKEQYRREEYLVELYPGKTLKVNKGDTIAWSGNTGGSAAPHLHFEIRKIATGEPVDPQSVGFEVLDTMKPRIRSVRIYQKDDTVLSQTGAHRYRTLSLRAKKMTVPEGEYALGVHWVDYHVDYMNKLGINDAALTRGNQVIFKQHIDRFAFDETKMINLHVDYPTYNSTHRHYVKFYKEKGNTLRFYSTTNNGWMKISAGDTVKLQLTIHDHAGLADTVNFTLIGTAGEKRFYRLPRVRESESETLISTSGGKIETPGCRAVFYPNTVFSNARLSIWKSKELAGRPSSYYYVHKDVIPLRKDFRVQIKVDSAYRKYGNKLVVMSESSRGRRCIGGEYGNGWIGASSRKLGGFYVDVDTVAPVVKVYQSGRRIHVSLYDKLSGIESFEVRVGDHWVLMDYEPKSSSLRGYVPTSVPRGKHKMVVRVMDERGNEKVIERNITI